MAKSRGSKNIQLYSIVLTIRLGISSANNETELRQNMEGICKTLEKKYKNDKYIQNLPINKI